MTIMFDILFLITFSCFAPITELSLPHQEFATDLRMDPSQRHDPLLMAIVEGEKSKLW